MEAIYERPQDYDLEHEGDDEDVRFYADLVRKLRPRRVLELASGSGRVTVPLAALAPELDFDIVGLEIAEPMLDEARRKAADLDDTARTRLNFVEADMLTWRAPEPFDLIITPCSSLSHVLDLDDQLRVFSTAHDNLAPGGRFIADLVMPNLPAYAESMQSPPRTTVEIDVDTRDPDTGVRMLRQKTTRYLPHRQRAEIRFLYDKFDRSNNHLDRYVSDFESHVYYPRELELLFRAAGFEIETRFGDYSMRRFRASSRLMIVIGRRRRG